MPDFHPDWASPPGDTIRDILAERGLGEEWLAQELWLSPDALQCLLAGTAPIALALARRLSEVLGASAEFWMVRDYQYRQDAGLLTTEEKEAWGQLRLGL